MKISKNNNKPKNSKVEASEHIKCAIDCLGSAKNVDAVSKDSIANLSVVLLDLKSSNK